MTLRGDEHGADLYRSLRGTMENWEKAISSGPGEEAPRARWEAVFNTVKTIAEKIVSSGRLPPVLE
ncbi:hypothetical protein ISS86_03340 [Candidatus Microgenomates bacterium]|nr:hypothetical protein [Candidatus Microgenomates bacterium]